MRARVAEMTTPQSRSARLVRWLLASGAGLALALAFFQRYVRPQVTALLDRALLLVYLVLVFTLVGYGLLFWVALPRLRAAGRAPVAWGLGALAAGCLLAALLALQPARPRPHTLELIATGQRNPAARGSEVWVRGLYRADGSQVAVSELALEGDWEIRDGVPLSYRNQPATLRWTGVLDGDAVLRLLAHPWSGVVQVRWDGRTETIDLYADAATTRELALPHVPPVGEPWAPVLRGVFLGADAISLGLGLLVIASIGMYHARVRPLGIWAAGLGGKELTIRGWPTVRALGIWAAGLGVGLVVLSGRYDWSSVAHVYSLRGYLSSAYMFVLFLPTLYYTLDRFLPQQRDVLGVTAVIAVLLTLPYRWLGLDRFYYYANRRQWYNLGEPGILPPEPDWFPDALRRLPAIPYEGLLFGGLFMIGVAIAALCWRRQQQSWKSSRNQKILGLFAIYCLILVQTWSHLSLRSPYTYVPHFEKPPEAGYWYHVYMFPDQKGAVNADLFVFMALEDNFIGTTRPINTMLIRRSFPFYLSSQISYFTNTLYIFIIFNIITWLLSVVCCYLFAKRAWSERAAMLSAAMVASGTGFIMFVGQPMNYLVGYAAISISIYLFQRIIIEDDQSFKSLLLFGALFGFLLMVYDLLPLIVFFVGFGFARRASIKKIFFSLLVSAFIYFGFLFLYFDLLGQEYNDINAKQATDSIVNIVALIRNASLNHWYILIFRFFELYLGHLCKDFFVLPLLPALIGLLLLRDRNEVAVISLLFAPSLLTLAILHFGGQSIAEQPRFMYITYPAIYILAAIALDRIADLQIRPPWMQLISASPWLFILLLVILNNIDVFGFPSTYYHFYWNVGNEWLAR